MSMLFFKVIIILAYACLCYSKKYHNYTLYQTIPDTIEKLNYLRTLEDVPDYDYWRRPNTLMKPVELLVAPNVKNVFIENSEGYNLSITTLIHDVQRAFDDQLVKQYVRRRMDSFGWENYYRTDDIYAWLGDLRAKYPNEMELKNIGNTYEHRPILMAKISLNSKARSSVIIEGGIHAREWVSIAGVTYLLHQILTSQTSNNDALKRIATQYIWYFVPILNPDGYEYSHTTDRMYRKNLRQVDLNRNFNYAFGSYGISANPNSEIYCGNKAFSELESQAMRDFVISKQKNLEFYLTFHAYGQFMIIPYGDTSEHLENFEEVKTMAGIAIRRILNKYSSVYKSGNPYETAGYKTSGNSACWVKKTFHVPYVMSLEMRDQGRYGFALPPALILPACREISDGVVTFISMKDKYNVRFDDEMYKENNTSRQRSTGLMMLIIFYYLFS